MRQARTAAVRTEICSCGRSLALATGLILIFPCLAISGLIGDGSWTRESEDGRYLLVMLYRRPQSEHDDAYTVELKSKYSQSGVYLRGNSKETLLWPLPYQSRAYRTFFSPDGDHILMAVPTDHNTSDIPPWAALHFYHMDGTSNHWLEYQITWGYGVKELLLNRLLRREWNEWTEMSYNRTSNTVTVKTNHPEEFVFDMTTGRKLHTKSDWDLWSAVFLTCMPALMYGISRIAQSTPRMERRATFWQVSLAEVLLLMTAAAVLLALARFSAALSIAVLLVGLGGGAIAQLLARGRLSWCLGGLAAAYGTFVGLVLFGTVGEALMWRLLWVEYYVVIALFLGLCLSGGVMGAVFGGRMAKRRMVSESPTPVL